MAEKLRYLRFTLKLKNELHLRRYELPNKVNKYLFPETRILFIMLSQQNKCTYKIIHTLGLHPHAQDSSLYGSFDMSTMQEVGRGGGADFTVSMISYLPPILQKLQKGDRQMVTSLLCMKRIVSAYRKAFLLLRLSVQ